MSETPHEHKPGYCDYSCFETERALRVEAQRLLTEELCMSWKTWAAALQHELKHIKSWAQTQHDEDGKAISKIEKKLAEANTEIDMLRGEVGYYEASERIKVMQAQLDAALLEVAKMHDALSLIATPMRPDGTWNRDRAACQELAIEALDTSLIRKDQVTNKLDGRPSVREGEL